MFELHPAVEHLAEKGHERASLDEMAIVNLMRRSLNDAFNNYQQLKVWLQQENPLNLKGPELTEWATEIASWVLPTQMRGINAKQITQASQTNGSSSSQQELRQESGSATESGQEIQSS